MKVNEITRIGGSVHQKWGSVQMFLRYSYTNVPYIYRVSTVYQPYMYRDLQQRDRVLRQISWKEYWVSYAQSARNLINSIFQRWRFITTAPALRYVRWIYSKCKWSKGILNLSYAQSARNLINSIFQRWRFYYHRSCAALRTLNLK